MIIILTVCVTLSCAPAVADYGVLIDTMWATRIPGDDVQWGGAWALVWGTSASYMDMASVTGRYRVTGSVFLYASASWWWTLETGGAWSISGAVNEPGTLVVSGVLNYLDDNEVMQTAVSNEISV
jgi:hypothetical protein